MTIRFTDFAGRAYTLDNHTVEPSCLGPCLVGWYTCDGSLWPEDWGSFRVETCQKWAFA